MIFLAVLLSLFANNLDPFYQERSLQACSNKFEAKTAGTRFKFSLPKDATLKHVDDVDYRNYFIAFGKGKNRVWMSGGFGPHWSGGNPTKGRTEGLVDLQTRNWIFEKRNDRGVDIKGKTADGKYSRFFGAYGETIQYDKVPRDAATYFDQIIDTVCYQERGV